MIPLVFLFSSLIFIWVMKEVADRLDKIIKLLALQIEQREKGK